MRACAFFSPSLDPVLDRGEGHKDAVVSPQVPTRRAVGQAILGHDPHGEVNHPVGVMAAGWGQVRKVYAEVLATLCTIVLRIGDHQVTGTPGVEIAQIMQRALLALVTIGLVSTTRTGMSFGVATAGNNLWLWEIRRARDAFRRIGPVDAGSWHTWVLLGNKVGTGNIRRNVLACLYKTRFLYYSVKLSRFLDP